MANYNQLLFGNISRKTKFSKDQRGGDLHSNHNLIIPPPETAIEPPDMGLNS